VADPLYGYQSINVDTQKQTPHSLLHWMRRMIAIRKQYQVFGRGTLEFLSPTNEKILAYLRTYEQQTVLLVHNLAESAQAVELALGRFKGIVPIELFGDSRFPQIGEAPYMLSLGPYGSYWFCLPAVRSWDSTYNMDWSAI
jgi:Glycosidases